MCMRKESTEMPTQIIRSATAIGLCLLVAGCFSRPVDRNLVKALEPSGTDITVISSEKILECVNELPRFKPTVTPQSKAHYNQYAAYKIADIMKRGPKDLPTYADRIRAFSYTAEVDGWFSKKKRTVLCYFEKKDNQLIYLTEITPEADGSVDKIFIRNAIQKIYEKMRGKPLSFGESFMFGSSLPI